MDLFIFVATTRLKIDASNCDGPQKTVIDDSKNRPNITSHCNCEIKSNFTGELFFTSNHSCSPGFHVFDDNGKIIENICDNKRAHFRKNVFTGDSLKLVLINNSSNQSENLGEIVQIYASMFEKYIPFKTLTFFSALELNKKCNTVRFNNKKIKFLDIFARRQLQ